MAPQVPGAETLATVRQMSARVRETGAVFTRKRATIAAGGAGIFVDLAGVVLFLVTRPTANAVHSGVLGISTDIGFTASPSPAASSTPAPTPTPSPTVATNVSSTPAPADTSTGTTSQPASQPAGPPTCTTVARFATLQVGFTSYRQDQTVQATTTIVNHGPTCNLTNNTVTANFLASNGAVVHAQTVGVTSNTTWVSGQTLSTTFSWNLQDCSTSPCTAQPPGAYAVAVTWPGVKTISEGFSVVPALVCTASDVQLAMTTVSPVNSHSNVVVNATLTNVSGHACGATESTELIIKNQSGTVVFAAGLGASSNSSTWNPGQALKVQYSWNQTTCSGCSVVPRGTYEITLIDTGTGATLGPLGVTLVT